MSNSDDLKAINTWVQNSSKPASTADASAISKWQSLKASWDSWYPGVISSWYVSDNDLANGRAKRDALQKNKDLASYVYVQQTVAAGSAGDSPAAKTGTGTSAAKVNQYWTTHPSAAAGSLAKGSKNEDVIALQLLLISAGCLKSLGIDPKTKRDKNADGKFGTDTENAVKCWQKKHGLAQTGVWGANEALASTAVAATQTIAEPTASPPVAVNPKPPVSKPPYKPPQKPSTPATTVASISKPNESLLYTIGAGIAGAAAGFFAGGPAGAAIGAVVGGIGGNEYAKRVG